MRKHIRIAIMGAKQAGKTVLLTAIHNRLQYLVEKQKQDKAYNGWRVVKCDTVELADGGDALGEFPIETYKNYYLGEQAKWPDSTTRPARLCYELTLHKDIPEENWLRRRLCGGDVYERRLTVDFLDMPGERMTDIATMRDRSFREWSDIVCKACHNSRIQGVASAFETYRNAVYKIIEKQAQDGSKSATQDGLESESVQKQIYEEYKKVVVTLMKEYSPFITPSDMQLGEDGKLPEYTDDTKELAKRLDLEKIGFVPLPKKFFDGKHKELVRSFKNHYDEYRKKKEVLFKWLSNVDQIYFLVDVLGILEHGRGRYEGVKGQIDLAFPKKDSWLHWLWKGVCGRNVSRICMVATQVDRTNIERDKGNIKKLLEILFKRVNQCSRAGMKKDVLLCSAVKSTTSKGKSDDKIEGTFVFGCRSQVGPASVPRVPDEFDFKEKRLWLKALPVFRRPEEEETPDYNLNELLARMLCVSEHTVSAEKISE